MSTRERILERRARFVAAAAAAMVVGCDGVSPVEPQVCLSQALTCDRAWPIEVPADVCVGDRFDVRLSVPIDCHAVYATSDPELLVLDGRTAIALKPGKVTITAIFDTGTSTADVEIHACAVDAATDVPSDAASDALSDTASDVSDTD